MAEKFKEFLITDILHSDEEIADFLNDAYLDEDPRTFIVALGEVAKAKGIAQVAEETGLNRESLYKALSGNRKPQWETIQRVMKALNLRILAAPA